MMIDTMDSMDTSTMVLQEPGNPSLVACHLACCHHQQLLSDLSRGELTSWAGEAAHHHQEPATGKLASVISHLYYPTTQHCTGSGVESSA